MTEMNAVVLDEWGGDLTVESVPVPEPAPDEVRIEVQACGVTRTNENAIQGGLDDDPGLVPRIPGHECAGVVDGVGEDVSSVTVGDRVFAYFYLTCGECDACRRGETNQCTDFGGWYGVDCDGAYAEYATLPAANALPMPDDLSFAGAAVATDGLATPLRLCERADVSDEDAVLVIGAAGRVGIHLAQLAERRGAHVIAADVHGDRLAHVDRHTGPQTETVDVSEGDVVERLRAAAPDTEGPTVAVDTVGDVGTLQDAWDSLAMGGRIVSLTTHHDRRFAPPLKEFVVKEAELVGARHTTKAGAVRSARLVADGRVEPVVRNTVGLADVPDVHEAIRTGETFGMTVLDPSG
ncbi:MAG: alcohol dehydrogenase catalytic domain-containing protein [Halovenus sp.]